MDCRFYEKEVPSADEIVVVQVKRVDEMGGYVSLVEYNNIEGMILYSEVSKRRIRSITKALPVGKFQTCMVIRVDKDKGYIDLSKKRVSADEVAECDERFNKAKTVHSIMRHLSTMFHIDLVEVHEKIAWPFYKKFGHAYNGLMKIIVDDLETLAFVDSLDFTYTKKTSGVPAVQSTRANAAHSDANHTDLKAGFLEVVRRRLTPKALRLKTEVEVSCFTYEGVLAVKAAMMKAQAAVNKEFSEYRTSGDQQQDLIHIKLISPPLYVITTNTTLNKDLGFKLLNRAIELVKANIESVGGKFAVKIQPEIVGEDDEYLRRQRLVEDQSTSGESGSESEDDGSSDDGDEGMDGPKPSDESSSDDEEEKKKESKSKKKSTDRKKK